MKGKRGQQQGAQKHAEGQHGEKTHRAFIEQLHQGAGAAKPEAESESQAEDGRRPHQDREQHDGADKNSEKP